METDIYFINVHKENQPQNRGSFLSGKEVGEGRRLSERRLRQKSYEEAFIQLAGQGQLNRDSGAYYRFPYFGGGPLWGRARK